MLNETRVLYYLDTHSTRYCVSCTFNSQFLPLVGAPGYLCHPVTPVSAFRLDVALIVGGVLIGGVAVVASHLKVRKIHLIAEDTADASEAPDEL